MDFEKQVKTLRRSMEFTHGLRQALMFGLGLIYFISLGFDVIWVTTLFALSTIVMILFEFPTGAIADYDSRKKSLMISFLLFSFAFLGIFLFSSFWVLACFWILADISWTFYSGAGLAWAIDALNYSKDKLKIVSLISGGIFFNRLGGIIGGIIGFFIIAINFRFIWLAISIFNLLMFFVVLIFMEERNFKPEKVPYNYLKKSIIKAKESISHIIHQDSSELRAIMFGSIFSVSALSIFYVAMPLFFTDILNFSPENLSLIYAILGVFTLISSFIASWLAKIKGFRLSIFILSILVGGSMILFGLPEILLWAMVGLGSLKVFATSLDILEDCALQHEFSSKIRASLGSISSIQWGISNSISVFFAGILITYYGIIPTIIISALIVCLAGFVYLIGMKK